MARNRTRLTRAGVGACGSVCCAVPLLVTMGVVSIGAAQAGGLALGAIGVVAWTSWLTVRGRSPGISDSGRRLIFTFGGTMAAAGLLTANDDPRLAAMWVVGGDTALASVALLELGGAASYDNKS